MLHSLSSKSYKLAIGLAFFAMFFGSGNLIFPLSIGYFSQNQWLIGSLGFLLSGVLLPFLGIITMVMYKGDYQRFFKILGEKGSFIFVFALLSAWIPFGSGPRCVILSYVNIQNYLPGIPLWGYSLVYCAILYVIVLKKSTALDVLGYVLTPALLLCLVAVIYFGISASPGFNTTDIPSPKIFFNSLVEGYQTQDLIASFFFASVVIDIISNNRKDGASPVQVAFQSSIIGMVLLAAIYIGLILLSASSGQILVGVPKEAFLSVLVEKFLHSNYAFLGSVVVALACFTTSIALTIVYSDFLYTNFFNSKGSNQWAIFITVLLTFLLSLTGFTTISAIISPLMQVFYPCLIGLIIWNVVVRSCILNKPI